jgi:hypothetical protein
MNKPPINTLQNGETVSNERFTKLAEEIARCVNQGFIGKACCQLEALVRGAARETLSEYQMQKNDPEPLVEGIDRSVVGSSCCGGCHQEIPDDPEEDGFVPVMETICAAADELGAAQVMLKVLEHLDPDAKMRAISFAGASTFNWPGAKLVRIQPRPYGG